MTDDLAPGWYPRNDGSRAYWDGSAWLDIPEPDGMRPKSRRRFLSSRKQRTVAAVSAVVLAALAGGSIAAVAVHNNNVEDERQATADAAERRGQDAAERKAAAEASAAAAERKEREEQVTQVERSVKKMATGHAKDGVLDTPPLKEVDASCEPVDGSFDDLLAPTTTFKCFVPTKKADGGMYEGFNYHATMNWESGEYTYGMGEP